MKFPYELSKQRQSLLSKEDQQTYLIEHSIFYSYTEKQKAIKQYQKALLERQGYYIEQIDEDDEYNKLDEEEKQKMAKELSIYESSIYLDDIADIFKEYVGEDITNEDYQYIKEKILETINTPIDDQLNEEELNEDGLAPGHDMTYWMQDMGWLGKLAMGLLSTAFASMIALIMAGKDMAAMKLLEKTMNKLVEKTDDGIHKKKTILGLLFPSIGKHSGDQSKACFRQIQEDYLRTIACDAMVFTKAMGFLSDNWSSAANDVESNICAGGMKSFLENVGFPVSNLSSSLHKD